VYQKDKVHHQTTNDSKILSRLFVALIAALFLFIFAILYEVLVGIKNKTDEKIEAFTNGSVMICKQDDQSTLVSKQTGWSIYNNKYFLKDGILLDISLNCIKELNNEN
jgi:hypothetical protein